MDEARFDGWTRRSFGLAASGLAVSLCGLIAWERAEAGKSKKRKRKKKRCRKSGEICAPGGHRCCKGLVCFERTNQSEEGVFTCCKEPGTSCTADEECCAGLGCTDGLCCKSGGTPCERDDECCGAAVCVVPEGGTEKSCKAVG